MSTTLQINIIQKNLIHTKIYRLFFRGIFSTTCTIIALSCWSLECKKTQATIQMHIYQDIWRKPILGRKNSIQFAKLNIEKITLMKITEKPKIKTGSKIEKSKLVDSRSLPFNKKKEKIEAEKSGINKRVPDKEQLHKISLAKPTTSKNKLNAIIEEENGVRDASRKGKLKKDLN